MSFLNQKIAFTARNILSLNEIGNENNAIFNLAEFRTFVNFCQDRELMNLQTRTENKSKKSRG